MSDTPLNIPDLITENDKKIISNLNNIDPTLSDLYSNLLYFQNPQNQIPFYKSLITHIIREMINVMTRGINEELSRCIENELDQLKKIIQNNVYTNLSIDRKLEPKFELLISDTNIIDDDNNPEIKLKAHLSSRFLKINEREKLEIFLHQNYKIKSSSVEDEKKELSRLAGRIIELKKWVMPITHFHKDIEDNLQKEDYNKDHFDIKLKEFRDILLNLNKVDVIKNKSNIDKLIQSITKDNIKKILRIIKKQDTLKHYFYKTISDPNAFECLNEQKVFNNPPVFLEKNKDNTYMYINWHQGIYLKKIAAQKSKEVLGVIKENINYLKSNFNNDKPTNAWFFGDVLEILNQLDEKYLKDICSLLIDIHSLKIDFGIYPYDNFFTPLIRKLLNNKVCKEEMIKERFFINLLSLEIEETIREFPYGDKINKYNDFVFTACFEKYSYKKILDDIKDIFSDNDLGTPLELFNIILEVFKNSFNQTKIKHYDDLIHKISYRRSSIEPSEQYSYSDDYTDIILDALRDSGEAVIKNNNFKAIQEIFSSLEKETKNTLLCRLRIHLARMSKDMSIATPILTNEEIFRNTDCHHEYYHLMKELFGDLTEDGQNKVLSFIETGSKSDWDGWTKEYEEGWKFRKLSVIKDNLKGSWKQEYDRLLKTNSEDVEYPDFTHWTSTSMAPIVDKDRDDFKYLYEESFENIVKKAKEFIPEEGQDKSSKRGLAETIGGVIKKRLTDFIKNINLFKDKDIDVIYIENIFFALAFNDKQILELNKKEFSAIFDYIEWFISSEQAKNSQIIYGRDGDIDIGCSIILKYISSLLKLAFNHNLIEENIVIAKQLFKILSYMINSKDPNLDKTEADIQSNDRDTLTTAINTMKGQTLEAIIKFGLWLQNNSINDFNLNDLEKLIDKQLEYNYEGYILRSIYGTYLPWINLILPEWAKRNINIIFPQQEKKKKFFASSFYSYISHCRAYGDLFDLVKDKILYFIKKDDNDDLISKDFSFNHLGYHIIAYYIIGKLTLDDKIMKKALDNSSKKVAEGIMAYITQAYIRQGKAGYIAKPDEIYKFKELFNYRIEQLKGLDLSSYNKELIHFFQWYGCGKFDNEWALDYCEQLSANKVSLPQYNEGFYTQLLKEIPNNISKAINIISGLQYINQEGYSLGYIYREQGLKEIFQTILKNKERLEHQDKEKFNSILNFLSEKAGLIEEMEQYYI